MLTDNGREFCGTERHPYELYLALNDIEHRKTKVRSPRTNGFVERFNGTVLEEFFRPAMHAKLFESVEALQADLDAWLSTAEQFGASGGVNVPHEETSGPARAGHSSQRFRLGADRWGRAGVAAVGWPSSGSCRRSSQGCGRGG